MTAEHSGLRRPEQWARTQPDEVAVVDDEITLTYLEWNEQANKLAEALAGLRFSSQLAAVRTHMVADWFVINLALAKLAWRQIAVNWRLTVEEVRHILRDSGASLLFLDDTDPSVGARISAGLDVVPVSLRPIQGLTSLDELVAGAKAVPRTSQARPPLIVYTSGTTGHPKGVDKLSQASGTSAADPEAARRAKEYLRARREQHQTRHRNRTLVTLPLHHGAGEGQVQRSLAAGGTVYLLDRFDPVRALQMIHRWRITHWTTVPTMLNRIRALPEGVLARFDVSCLEMLGVGSAPVPYSLKLWAIDYFGEGRLYEAYGATEVGIITSMPPQAHRAKPGSCGMPLDHVEVRVTNDQGQPVPPGTVGELQVRTPLMIRKYVTGSRLATDEVTEEGFFRVGDTGKVDEDGYVYVTGRVKDMIIAGGVNIYPAEVERILLEHDEVIDAAVVGVPDKDMGERVVAFCESRPGSMLTSENLLASLEGKLARFKWPREIHFIAELPRNGMSKVIKSQLREVATPADGGHG
jgi:long-chain acyl-CoA synthetase